MWFDQGFISDNVFILSRIDKKFPLANVRAAWVKYIQFVITNNKFHYEIDISC